MGDAATKQSIICACAAKCVKMEPTAPLPAMSMGLNPQIIWSQWKTKKKKSILMPTIIIIICFTSFPLACFLIWWDSLVAQKPFGYFPFSFGRSEITNQNPKSNAANFIHLPFSKASHLSVSSSEINFCYLCTLLALQSIHGSKFCCHHLLTMVSCDW